MTEQNQQMLESNNNRASFKIKSDEVTYICGKRQTGKSYMLEHIAKGFPKYVIYDGATHQHQNMGVVVRKIEEFIAELDKGTPHIVCQPYTDGQEIFDKYCKEIWKRGNMVLMIEELGNYCDSFSASEYFDMITRVGRNRGIGIIALNQRPSRIWNNFVGLIEHWIIFRTELPRDLKFLEEYIGEQRAESLKALPKRYFYYKNEEGTILCNPI